MQRIKDAYIYIRVLAKQVRKDEDLVCMGELTNLYKNRYGYGGKVVSLTRRPPFTPQEDSWYSFLLEAGKIMSNEESSDTENGRRVLPACSIVPEATTLSRALKVCTEY
jgi:hypothetical protein